MKRRQRIVRAFALIMVSVGALLALAVTAMACLLFGAAMSQGTIHEERNGIIIASVTFILFWTIMWAVSYLENE